MSIYSAAVKKPVSTIMIFMAVIVFGIYSLFYLPVDMYPEIEPPYITVMTTYVGANAEEIETNVTKLIEDGLNSVDDLKEVTSRSEDNVSVVTLEFDWEADLTEAVNDIRDALEFVKDDLPDDAESPLIFKFNTSSFPILFYAVNAKESFNGLEKILEEKIVNPLNRVNGIGSVSVIGAPGRRIYVECDPLKLDAYGITVEQIGQIISTENMNVPSGHIKMGQFDYQLRVDGEFNDSYELENLVVGNSNGKTVYLKDLATVHDTKREKELDERFEGNPGMRLMIMKQSGANTVQVANDAKAMLEELKESLPPDVNFFEIMDSSSDIEKSINNLSQTLMFALIFVVLVVLLFLGRWRATFIIVLTIPISLIVAFTYLYVSGNSINIISLSSLSIAIGMVVDDAIVVLENIMKHIERGSSPREAAIYATKEVWLSVIATTLVVVAVFFPLTLVGGQTGVLFKQLGWIVTITVVTSTIAAISLTPMLSAQMLRLREKRNGKPSIYDRTVVKTLDSIDNGYAKIVDWSIHHKKVIIPAVAIIFISSMMLAKSLKFENMPEQDQSQMEVNIELQTGMRVEESMATARQIEAYVKSEMPEVQLTYTSSGSDDEGGISSIMFESATHTINMRLKLVDIADRERSVWQLADIVREKLEIMPEIISYTVSTSTGMSFGGGSNGVDVEIYGYDIKTTTLIANEVAERLKTIEGAADVKISREKEKPQLQVVFDREKLSEYGLNTSTASMAVRNRISGMIASKFREEGDEYDIVVRYDENARNTIADIENITIMTPTGKLVRVSELGTVEEYWAPPRIERKQRQRLVTVSAVAAKGLALSDLAELVKAELETVDFPSEVWVSVGGAYQDMQENAQDLGLLFLIIIILVYIVMASQFESLKMPFIIMLSILFSFSGVVVALYITNTTMSTIAMLGAILLVGIVVKNGIVMIDFMNLLRERGVELHEATVTACRSRLRPILMTALTTILGMMPMALSVSEGSEIWAPMGITVIGGLLFSTIITLVIVPVVYVMMARHGARDKKAKVAKTFKFLDH
ncbi:efflux RND transporter permease subunit [Carboxylicivirga linearis]|uniref:Efflux RND transporter permease subunit n=1 Tax=Carboxylicivirga linearis TaxID=1628157 RepID=A0ABS5JPB5_9BACT|nr:efflux RND transporter permease subunit [Carboxylicivirga linearis]MBS2096738.1 efflux RND transporter permease subunit [Carboxylicivirga linearis]